MHDFGERNCGNGVLLRHGDSWETQYCYLRRGSIAVVHGNEVTVGQQLGLVGMSGEANFPHVHLTVRREGTAIDPFTGAPGAQACKEPGTPLWSHALREWLAYNEVPIAVVGLTDHVPKRDAIVSGTAGVETLSRRRPGTGRLCSRLWPSSRGDRLEITDPRPRRQATVSEAGFDLDEEAPRATRAAGRCRPPEGWAPGTYRVERRRCGAVPVSSPAAPPSRSLSRAGRHSAPAAPTRPARPRPPRPEAQDQDLRDGLGDLPRRGMTTAATWRPISSSGR